MSPTVSITGQAFSRHLLVMVVLLLALFSDFERTSVQADPSQLPSCTVSKIVETYTEKEMDRWTDGRTGKKIGSSNRNDKIMGSLNRTLPIHPVGRASRDLAWKT